MASARPGGRVRRVSGNSVGRGDTTFRWPSPEGSSPLAAPGSTLRVDGASSTSWVPPAAGEAGASAQKVYERRRAHREQRLRRGWGPLGGLAVAVSSQPQHEAAWARGADGERKLAAALAQRASKQTVLLHDRRVLRDRGNIDHLAISLAGVFVIDAKRYKRGPVRVERRGGLLKGRSDHRLIGGRDKSSLLDGVLRQADAVGDALTAAGVTEIPVRGVLAFVEGDLPWLGTVVARGVVVSTPRRVAKLVNADGPLDAGEVMRAARLLDRPLPAAA